MSSTFWFRAGCLSLSVGVALGAFGAHGLKSSLSKKLPEKEVNYYLDVWAKGSHYHFVHSLGMLLVAEKLQHKALIPCTLFGAGILLFSGSLYSLVLTQNKKFGAVAPLGGASFIAAWTIAALLI
uniref:DUF423 domain-containing protein n=1 Tax=Percolomonas cosmopolitus TaxID=63605 RepID=A0A7S1PGW4_9EUKA